MSSETAAAYRQFRVPQESGRGLIDPALEVVRRDLHTLDTKTELTGLEFCGKSISVVRCEARREAVELARQYTRRYQNIASRFESVKDSSPIILAGHQPELFHPGVWFKNFLLSKLAADSGAVAINFLVDNDLCRSTAIRVPTRTSDGSVIATSVPFDAARDGIPWEQRELSDRECWRNFPMAVRSALLPEVEHPLVDGVWKFADESLARTGRIGLAIAEARHRIETEMGLETLEVPLSQLASTRAFARFSIQLLSELPRLQAVYNEQREIYRAAHRIRSQAHPVPALEQQHGWFEAPWWVYSAKAPKRQRLWVKLTDSRLTLSDRAGWQAVIEGRLECDQAASQWLEILSSGVCLRPRALLTTMYARLIVGDAFIHGIGGGKYDQLTDAIIREFFGVEPPRVIVASATVRLPIANAAMTESSVEQRERLWRLKYHAESVSQSQAESELEMTQLAARKRELLSNIPARGDKWEWHHQITAVNKRLAELVAAESESTKAQLEQATIDERQQRILASREYSFCLFEREFLQREFQRMLG